MGFMNASASFTRYYITEPVPSDLWPQIPDKLKQFAFKEIEDTAEERGWGWVCFDDMLDSFWRTAPPEKGEFITFSLRLDTRRIPSAVLKKHVALELREEERKNKEQGKKYVSRERKKEIREQVQLKLRARSFPIPAEFNVVWNIQTGAVYLASTQSKVLELFEEYFSTTFGLDLEPMTPYALAVRLQGEDVMNKLDTLEPTRFA
ncbi:recombination-associated protein RdgC [Desulfovibrio mangrovi]|uniref:recombination-associated protein RdgC n=1 Tax=Desulfovibrio mangrovi TaxID=2976983 RepID=UPI00224626BB|nr:recombination-associated protein RdgC [Desulfovibrio mangrovi]UZP68861.1 recombination-associated protein RdgC [Desulfovibrio mangrovi]